MFGQTSGWFKIVIAGLFVANLAALAWVWVAAPMLAQRAELNLGKGDYALTTTGGETFTEATLVGEPSAVFFGFTHCPEVCPTTLGDVAQWQDELDADRPLRVFFVTVDPERDTADTLRDYVSWAPGVQGVTGTPEEIAKAIDAFAIFAQKVPLDDGGYTMDHSASVLLFDKNGDFVEPIRYQEEFDMALASIRRLLDGKT